ncbi:glutamine synthetase beta-grasp domain-containing protein, partial [Candidatus Igneacidithiobacillus taiwanensis]
MGMTPSEVVQLIADKDVKFIDFRFTDTKGKEQHVSVPAHTLEEKTFIEGKMF